MPDTATTHEIDLAATHAVVHLPPEQNATPRIDSLHRTQEIAEAAIDDEMPDFVVMAIPDALDAIALTTTDELDQYTRAFVDAFENGGGATHEELVDKMTDAVVKIIDPGGALFDTNAYNDPRLELHTKDGKRVNEIAVAFGGGVDLRRLNISDVEFFKSLRLGDEVELTVTCIVGAEGDTEKPPTEKRGKVIAARKTLRIHSIDIPAALEDAA